jgi:hypothetical protein
VLRLIWRSVCACWRALLVQPWPFAAGRRARSCGTCWRRGKPWSTLARRPGRWRQRLQPGQRLHRHVTHLADLVVPRALQRSVQLAAQRQQGSPRLIGDVGDASHDGQESTPGILLDLHVAGALSIQDLIARLKLGDKIAGTISADMCLTVASSKQASTAAVPFYAPSNVCCDSAPSTMLVSWHALHLQPVVRCLAVSPTQLAMPGSCLQRPQTCCLRPACLPHLLSRFVAPALPLYNSPLANWISRWQGSRQACPETAARHVRCMLTSATARIAVAAAARPPGRQPSYCLCCGPRAAPAGHCSHLKHLQRSFLLHNHMQVSAPGVMATCVVRYRCSQCATNFSPVHCWQVLQPDECMNPACSKLRFHTDRTCASSSNESCCQGCKLLHTPAWALIVRLGHNLSYNPGMLLNMP